MRRATIVNASSFNNYYASLNQRSELIPSQACPCLFFIVHGVHSLINNWTVSDCKIQTFCLIHMFISFAQIHCLFLFPPLCYSLSLNLHEPAYTSSIRWPVKKKPKCSVCWRLLSLNPFCVNPPWWSRSQWRCLATQWYHQWASFETWFQGQEKFFFSPCFNASKPRVNF